LQPSPLSSCGCADSPPAELWSARLAHLQNFGRKSKQNKQGTI
jgi:hypothetical protein